MADFVGCTQGPPFASTQSEDVGKQEFSGRVSAATNFAATLLGSHTLRQPQILLEFYRRYYNHTAILDRLIGEVLADMATSYKRASPDRHNCGNSFLAL
jgi:hypothetical protein